MLRPIAQGDLLLRPLSRSDSPALFALTEGNRQYLRQWLPWLDATLTAEDTERFIEESCQRHTRGEGLEAGIWQGTQLIGVIGMEIDWGSRRGVVGYWLGARYQGRGAMSWACGSLVECAFAQLGLNRLEIRCAPDNLRSRSLAERLGFRQEGLLRQAEWLYDHFVDHVVYGLLAAEWQETR